MVLIRVFDKSTKCCCAVFDNNVICCALSSGQLIVVLAALAQHILSMAKYQNIFMCMTNQTALAPEDRNSFLAADIIIFDFGLFSLLLHKNECIANYLDGGYMRALYCLGQILAILLLYLAQTRDQPHQYWLAPMLIIENMYVLGLLVLTLATLNPLITTIMYRLDFRKALMIGGFVTGVVFNFFLNYVLWHYYWYLEACNKNGWTNIAQL